MDCLGDGGQVVLDLRWRQLSESLGVADADLDVVLGHLALERLLERENGRVNGVPKLELLRVALLQEGLAVDVVLADSSGLPREIGAL